MGSLAFGQRTASAALAIAVAALVLTPVSRAAGPESGLDGRGWELASPVEKNGGEVSVPGGAGAAVTQAAAGGGAIAFGSAASFSGAVGAAPVSQYVARRGPGSWSTENLTPPLLSGTYSGGAYQLFSPDLSRAILANGWSCRDGGEACVAENPPLGAGAPIGYRNLYLRESGQYTPLITTANAPALALAPEAFELGLEGASPDLRHVAISTCAALTEEAVEVPDVSGCDGAAPNLYEWSDGALRVVNVLPGQTESAPGAELAAPAGAVSSDGSRVYWRGADANLYLRQGGTQTIQVDAGVGGGGEFQAAAADGSVAFFAKAGHLYRFAVAAGTTTDLTPAGEASGALGASADGSHLYYLAASGLFLWHDGVTTKVAATADPSNLPAGTGTARVTADGTRLAFLSSASLTGYPNGGKIELYLYEAPSKHLLCASCNPKGSAPKGHSTIPAAIAAGEGPAVYKPRALSADGTRLFFDSADTLVSTDTNGGMDVYQWEAKGVGGCAKASGCVGLVSSGRVGSASFLDASADGGDAYFLTTASLLPADTGSADVYDARAGGGFPEPPPPIPCLGDACQGPAPGPAVPALATGLPLGQGNPPARFAQRKKHKRHRKHRRHDKGSHRHGKHRQGGRR